MPPCERSPGNLGKLTNEQLKYYGINPLVFFSMSPIQRLHGLAEAMDLSPNHVQVNTALEQESSWNVDNSLIIIKPELWNHHNEVEDFLGQIDELEVISRKDFVYKPWQYWSIYGADFHKNMETFPHGALLLLNSVVLQSRLIVIKHPPLTNYLEFFSKLNPQEVVPDWATATEDVQKVFNELIVKYPIRSLRQVVVQPIISKMGLDTMDPIDCPVECWSYCSIFRERTRSQNLETFNGVHTPKDRSELIAIAQVLSEHL